MDREIEEAGIQEGSKAYETMCESCKKKLQQNITKTSILLGPKHLMKLMEKILCHDCQKKIISAAKKGKKKVWQR